jgi:sigma-54-interacting transcriptional regulator
MLRSVSRFDMGFITQMPPLDDWSVFRGAHPHALLIGSEASADAAISQLLPFLRAPVVHWHPAAVADAALPATGTLVIWEVDTLDRMQQEQLLMWLDSLAADVQVISVGERAVFPLVVREQFLDTLYYRLNIVCLTLENNLALPIDANSTVNAGTAHVP